MKRKGLIIGIIVALVVLMGAGVLYIFAGDYIENQVALMTKSDTEYYVWLSNRQIKSTRAKLKLAETVSGLKDRTAKPELPAATNAEGTLSLHVTDTFCDMFNLVKFKDEQLKIRLAGDNSELGLELIPIYGGNELITLRTLIDMDKHGVYVQLPTYRDEVIDLNPLLDKELVDGKSVKDIFAESFGAAGGTALLQTKKSKQMSADETAEYLRFMADSYTEATLEKKQTIDINGELLKVTKVTVSKSFSELVMQLQGLLSLLKADGFLTDIEEPVRMLAEIQKGNYASAKTALTMFVDMRGNIRGCDIEFDVNATKVGLTVIQTEHDASTVSDILVFINSLKAADIAAVTSRKDGNVSCELTVTPEAFVQTILPDYKDMSVKLELSGIEQQRECKVSLLKGAESIADMTVSTAVCDKTAPIIDLAACKVIPADTVLESEYVNVNDIIGMLLDIVDKIDEPFVNDYIDSLLAGVIGDSVTVDSVREMYDMGLFGLVGGLSDLIGMNEKKSAVWGVVSMDPEEYVRAPYVIPKDDDVISYSYPELAGTANVGQYKGIHYAVPVSKDITPEQLQEKRDSLLKKLENKYLINQDTISVEMGDDIYMDIVPIVAGYPFMAYAYTDCYERMGDDAYGDGLDEMLLGMKVGDVREVYVTLGDQFGDFAGYSGTFRVTLKKIERYAAPTWSEAFICDYAGYSSLEECDKALMAELIAEADVSETAVLSRLADIIWEQTTINEISEETVELLRQDMYDRMYDESVEYGMRPEDYYISQGGTLEDFLEAFDDAVSENLELFSVYSTIAYAENLTVTGKEVNEVLESFEEDYGLSAEEIMRDIRISDISDMLIEEKIGQLIYDTAIITYE